MFRATRYRIAAMLLTAAAAFAGPSGYVINFSGQFGVMDLSTGNFAPIGPGTANTPDAIGGAPGGPFYTVDGVTGHLLRISAGGAVTDIGDTGTGPNEGPNGVSVMGSLTDGSLFALDFSNRLYSISSGSGALALLGTLALPQQESSYIGNMTTSFSGNGSTMFYTLEIFSGPNTTGPTLFRIDPLTLAVTSTPLIDEPAPIIGTGFVGGQMYAFSIWGDILKLDPGTGVLTPFGTYDSGATIDNPGPPFTGVFGVVEAPEPGTTWLAAAGLAIAVWRRARAAVHRPDSDATL